MCRTVASDVPADIVIQVNNITYLLHKRDLLPKCGLLQSLCSEDSSETSSTAVVSLHDIPGGESAFETCAKFCYGISINLSAHNFVSTFCTAKYLRMTESINRGNLLLKLEVFFNSCILQGWKDSLVALQSTSSFPEWSENLGIITKCIDSIVDKILTPLSEVKWSYTYTRPGYRASSRKQSSDYQSSHTARSVPRDWWTEDISILDIDLFRCILITVRSSLSSFPCQLIGEALHVYACLWLTSSSSADDDDDDDNEAAAISGSHHHQYHQSEELEKKRKILDSIVGLIPPEEISVSVGFMIRLLSMANAVGASPITKAELGRRAGKQLDKATLNDLMFATTTTTTRSAGHGETSKNGSSSCEKLLDIGLVQLVLESFFEHRRRQSHVIEETDSVSTTRSIRKVVHMIDSYLQVVASDAKRVPVAKFVSLAQAIPETARWTHDDLYRAIDIYLKEHPDISKADRKYLCGVLNCQRLSPEMRAHAVKSERLPLRTVVQILFFEQEEKGRATTVTPTHTTTANIEEIRSGKPRSGHRHHMLSGKIDTRRQQQQQEVLDTDPPSPDVVEEERSAPPPHPLPRGRSDNGHRSRGKGNRNL